METIPEYIISVSPKNQDNLSKSKALITPIDNQVSPKFFISKQSKLFLGVIKKTYDLLVVYFCLKLFSKFSEVYAYNTYYK